MEDRKIVQLLWARAESAIEAMEKKYGPRLLATAGNILGSFQDAEETVSDTYLAVWNNVPPKKPDPLTAFVYKVGRNLALKRLRDNTARKRDSRYCLSLEELETCIPGPALEDTLEAWELGRMIDGFLSTVSRENRNIFFAAVLVWRLRPGDRPQLRTPGKHRQYPPEPSAEPAAELFDQGGTFP